MYYTRLLGITALTVLSGCGNDTDTISSDPQKIQKLPNFTGFSVSTTPLKKANTAQFTTHIKNGVFMRYHQHDITPPVNDSRETSDPSTTSSAFSGTNQQEQNVNEADRVKYDGNYLYIAANQYHNLTQPNESELPHYIRIMKRNNNGLIQAVKDLPTSSNEYAQQQLFLEQDTLVSISANSGWFSIFSTATIEPLSASSTAPNLNHTQFELNFADVTTPEQADISHTYSIDGQLIESRVINNQLYLVSNFRPSFSGFDLTNSQPETQLKNYQTLNDTPITHFIPTITHSQSGDSQPLFNADECYLSDTASDTDGYDSIMTITRISLADPSQQVSLCVNTEVEGIYASETAIYTHSTHFNAEGPKSVIHKFTINEQAFEYSATGKLSGHFGQNMRNLRFSEYNNQLRVMTSEGNQFDGFEHKLRILRQQGSELVLISELPNQSHPTPIGKVNSATGIVDEDIYAVRFVDEQAYIVTFQQTDPLYVIDLKNAEAPMIKGALEIPGYSAYLHPIGDSLLLGIGQEVADITIPEQPNITQGAKVSLFDISDTTSPILLDSKVFPEAYTPAEQDYHSLSFVKTAAHQYRFTMPLERWIETGNTPQNYDWIKQNQLTLFEINSQTKKLAYMGSSHIKYEVTGPQQIPLIYGNEDRTVLHNDDIYYIHGNYIWHSLWQTPSANNGPL
ncbi:beta-propeller domain-containing protein [Pseudoalteromonas sp. MMG013]|uniref:beta-propeller domain-containing protein n=1 Tax=Pseudoalteromonas sp. MMG013 TaxID=2822687 RepID=UPI001B386F57|nr:beta-propeller domain-containing protein [Pseudoalteromonas sp. MMG013]MBQ4860395.1 beta-propeller domain-containing protein [Pseudoalteromonas sp. MMG013]